MGATSVAGMPALECPDVVAASSGSGSRGIPAGARRTAAIAAVALTSATFAAPSPAAVPPASAYDFLVRTGVIPIPGLGRIELSLANRCATSAAALESGDCPPPAAGPGGGGGGPLRKSMR
jgi:hypothetical protein